MASYKKDMHTVYTLAIHVVLVYTHFKMATAYTRLLMAHPDIPPGFSVATS